MDEPDAMDACTTGTDEKGNGLGRLGKDWSLVRIVRVLVVSLAEG